MRKVRVQRIFRTYPGSTTIEWQSQTLNFGLCHSKTHGFLTISNFPPNLSGKVDLEYYLSGSMLPEPPGFGNKQAWWHHLGPHVTKVIRWFTEWFGKDPKCNSQWPLPKLPDSLKLTLNGKKCQGNLSPLFLPFIKTEPGYKSDFPLSPFCFP